MGLHTRLAQSLLHQAENDVLVVHRSLTRQEASPWRRDIPATRAHGSATASELRVAGGGRMDARLARVAQDGAVAAHDTYRALVGARFHAQEQLRAALGVSHAGRLGERSASKSDLLATSERPPAYAHQKALNLRFRPVYLLSSGTSTPLPRICSFWLSTHCLPF